MPFSQNIPFYACLLSLLFGLVCTITVTAPAGTIIGKTVTSASGVNVDQFLGIPFGSNRTARFAPPVKAETLSNFSALQQPPACIEVKAGDPPPNFISPNQKEDCLMLNIYRPSVPSTDGGYAVMFWVYGGGFAAGYVGGSPDVPYYDGSSFAANQQVIIVEANYRLNIFGFPDADTTVIPMKERNPGMLDVQLALQWVQDNINDFGGNKDKVTAFGQSAGAAMIDEIGLTHGTSLFRAMILQSVTALTLESGAVRAKLANPWAVVRQAVGCSGKRTPAEELTCMRGIDKDRLRAVIDNGPGATFNPLYDQGVTTASSSQSSRRNIPTLIGHNYDDGANNETETITVPTLSPELVTPLLIGLGVSAEQVANIVSAYPVGPGQEFANVSQALGAVGTDLAFNCVVTRAALGIAGKGPSPVYRYVYNASFPNLQWSKWASAVTHGVEVPIVFGNLGPNPTQDQVKLSQLVQKWWADFAKTLNPGNGWTKLVNGNQADRQQKINVISLNSLGTRQPGQQDLLSNRGGSKRCYDLSLETIYNGFDAAFPLI